MQPNQQQSGNVLSQEDEGPQEESSSMAAIRTNNINHTPVIVKQPSTLSLTVLSWPKGYWK
ncbi:hypothetical protein [Paraflavitalea speifideaquila]|uniref:hypothetical protein n=1 Tax=Paraflavitalea speifideaquila TaxID=3076558 RepID=UPI0028E1BFDA|nr:hypothetical protein [Paraflavitalea speifideiaquila]